MATNLSSLAEKTRGLAFVQAEKTLDYGYVYNKIRTVYVRTAPGEPIQGVSLSTDLFEGIEPSSRDEAAMILGYVVLGWEEKLEEVDGALFEPSAEDLAAPQLNPLANTAVIEGAVVEWTVVDPETEPLILAVTREIDYSLKMTYAVRMTRAEYEEYVDANGGQEEGALEELVLTSHRGSQEAPDPRVEFLGEEETQIEHSFSTETEQISFRDLAALRPPPRAPFLDEATDAEIREEVQRRIGARGRAPK